MVSESRQRLKYLLSDFISSNVAWFSYNCVRYAMGAVHGQQSLKAFLLSGNVMLGQLLFPLLMMGVYSLSGYYNEVFRKSRLQELLQTASNSLINSLILFFVALINDPTIERQTNYELIAILWGMLFVCVYIPRAIITNHTSRRIKRRQWMFNTLVVGCGTAGCAFVERLERMKVSLGYNVVGYVAIPGENNVKNMDRPIFDLDDIRKVCLSQNIKEIIVIPTKNNRNHVLTVINKLFSLNLPIKIAPDKYNILLSRARLNDIHGDPLIDISSSSMTEGGKNMKRLVDIIVSSIALVFIAILYPIVALFIKLDTKGPVIYKQERIGYHNKVFNILKFRSMIDKAEVKGKPQLSSQDDPRITRVGRFLRKYRIDELPQFWNVLRGDMTLVGPRPERKHYVDLISERQPAYALVHQVRPGITSMGMVKFGYAQTVDQMLERLDYDLIYLENMSLLNDLKIVVYTLKIIITGKGV
ncbi:MAG: sugar transferase [Muribaculaceae bacterium]|nr:sugar transferase [Muribaculaceae bacterium]